MIQIILGDISWEGLLQHSVPGATNLPLRFKVRLMEIFRCICRRKCPGHTLKRLISLNLTSIKHKIQLIVSCSRSQMHQHGAVSMSQNPFEASFGDNPQMYRSCEASKVVRVKHTRLKSLQMRYLPPWSHRSSG